MKLIGLFVLMVGLAGMFFYTSCGKPPEEESLPYTNLSKAIFTISGMTCHSCSNHLTAKVKALHGVVNAKVVHTKATNNAQVVFDPTLITLSAIKKPIEASGKFKITYELIKSNP